ncbi:MAG TPA: tetratricopeptide repeat protein [Gemmatimonadales bacterium]|nr:tetratricopeptide repeat protein [Gemmatimonadales bacterium]
MANLEKYKEAARKFEQKEQWAKALEQYSRAIEEMEGMPEIPEAELPLYNRAGDLQAKVGDAQMAVTLYERAVDKYQEIGLANNAIALCNKIVRLAPGRAQIYLKLGMLFASKGFGAEAKTNLLEYADRMQKAGQLEEAFKALKKFAEMTPGQDEIWSVLVQQARASAKTPDQKEQVEKLLGEFEAKEKATQQRKSRMSRSQITGEELPPETGPKKGELVFLDLDEAPAPRKSTMAAAPPPPPRPAPPPPRPAAAAPPARKTPPPQPEPQIAAAPEPEPEIAPLEIEQTSLAPQEEAPPATPALELESTSLAEEASAPAGAADLGLEPTSLAEPAAEAPAPPEPAAAAEDLGALEIEIAEPPAEEPAPAASAVAGLPMLDIGEAEAPAEIPEVEVPGLEEPAAAEAPAAGSALEFIDLGEVEVAEGPSVADLEQRVAKNAQDWEGHRLLGEALLAEGERERGIAELDAALEGLEAAENLDGAYAIAEEVLRLEPNSVRHHQKRVELAYRQGDRARLADAYLELADALLRSGEADKAVAVYQRVLEHDPANQRAKSAIETLAPPPPPAAPPPRRATQPPAAAVATPAGGGDFVDLGAMLLEEDAVPKDTRMRIEDEEPSGDEQKDFQTMLSAFKKGVEANVEETDFQSHYDLGVAYKEMGLLDEAIAEFQKALRAPEGKLRASEALGLCFFEKGQFTVAETILRRALELPAAGDADRVGLLYWLGRTQEEVGKKPDALTSYNRVFAVDITFQDVSQRVQSLSRAGA